MEFDMFDEAPSNLLEPPLIFVTAMQFQHPLNFRNVLYQLAGL